MTSASYTLPTGVKPPFPYFGGKLRAAPLIWQRLGPVQNYVAPFCGSLAVELNAPYRIPTMTLNDLDGLLINFYRAVLSDPDAVAHHLNWPVSESDLFPTHVTLVKARDGLTQRLQTDRDWYDTKLAGWWCWGACSWIGTGWCDGKGPWTIEDGQIVNIRKGDAGQGVNRKLPHLGNAGRGVNRKLPHLGDAGRGVNRKLPHLGDAGRGVNRKLPHLGNAGRGVNRKLPHLGDAGQGVNRKLPHLGDAGQGVRWPTLEDYEAHLQGYMRQIAVKLRPARLTCGDWSRVVTPACTERHGLTGVLLDPPYGTGSQDYSVGGNADTSVAAAAWAWAVANGDNPLLRIAYCAYDDGREVPSGWTAERWKARKGYQTTTGASAANPSREMIYFSPHCVRDRSGEMAL